MDNFAIQTYLFGILFYTEVREPAGQLENMLLMVAVAIFTEGLYLKCNFSFMKLYSNPKSSYFEYFMLSCLNF